MTEKEKKFVDIVAEIRGLDTKRQEIISKISDLALMPKTMETLTQHVTMNTELSVLNDKIDVLLDYHFAMIISGGVSIDVVTENPVFDL